MNETRIGDLRRTRGWTQENLAEESGVASRTVQRLEAGHDASLETLSMVAKALEVPVRDLFLSVESGEFDTAVNGLDVRTENQKRTRASIHKGWRYLYIGIGILLTCASIIMINTTALYVVGLVLIPAYWIGGAFLLRFLDRVVIEPRLDSRYPLAVRERQTSS